MKQRKIESALFNEMCGLAPDMTEELLCACEESDTPAVITDISEDRKPGSVKRLVSLAAVLVLVFTAAFSSAVMATQKCTVIVDVNPSLELSVNGLRRVTDVSCNNQDAEELIKDCALKGERIDDAIATVTERLCDSGYISAEHNGMLLSVSSEKGKYADLLCGELIDSLNTAAKNCGCECAVLYQKIDGEDRDAVEASDMSVGKAVLAGKIGKFAQGIAAEDIRGFSVQELIALAVSLDRLPDDTLLFGSLRGYCSLSDAQAIALEDACSRSSSDPAVELISYGKELAYDIVLSGEDGITEYVISATTGEILSSKGSRETGGTQVAEKAPAEDYAVLSPTEAISKFIAAGGYLLSDVADILDDISITTAVIGGKEVYKITFELNDEWQTVYISKETAEKIG